MSERDDLVAHLRLYADMGINGISRDPVWRERADEERQTPNAADEDVHEPQAASEAPHAVSPAGQSEDPAAALVSLRAHIGDCTRCPLHAQGRKQVVFGVGSPAAQLMFVGEGPGADEDEQGEPFVGQAGQLLTKIIAAIDLTRSDVYIANVVKCRPPGNRNPEPVEVATCSPFLLRQIEIIRPKVIVALGAFAAQTLLQSKVPISKLRGQVHVMAGGTRVIPTFHPSFLLRNRNNRDLYRDVWEDVKKARALIAGAD